METFEFVVTSIARVALKEHVKIQAEGVEDAITRIEDNDYYEEDGEILSREYELIDYESTEDIMDWEDINPATKKVEGDYGEKYKGSVSEKESMITPENGFVLIETLEPGVSPLSVIEERDKRYEQMAKK